LKAESPEVSLSSIEFIVEHPWFFISPIVIIMSLTSAFLSCMPLFYQSSSILSLESPGGDVISAKFIQKKEDILSGVLMGDGIGNIAKEVWPDIDEKAEPVKYNNLVERLRSPKSGIKLDYNTGKTPTKPGGQEFLTVSFSDTDPNLAYNVVKTTVNMIKKVSKEKAEGEIEVGLVFLRKQLEFYKEKLQVIDNEISRLKIDLKTKYPDMTEDERYLMDEMLGGISVKDYSIKTYTRVERIMKYEDKSTELKLRLLELQKKKDVIQRQIEKKEFIKAPSLSPQETENDSFVKQYSAAIASKELSMSEFLSQGFTSEHPQIKQIQSEVQRLRALREQRIKELISSEMVSGGADKASEEKARNELKDIDSEIEVINMKIDALDNYKKTSEGGSQSPASGKNAISDEISKLLEIKNEKDINQGYYNDIRQQLEAAEIKSRLEKSDVGININVIEEPRVPLDPIPNQKLKFILMAFALSATIGTGLSYIVYVVDRSIKSSSELREFLQVPVLASIDRISTYDEFRIEKIRRNIIAISLITFALLSSFIAKILVKIF